METEDGVVSRPTAVVVRGAMMLGALLVSHAVQAAAQVVVAPIRLEQGRPEPAVATRSPAECVGTVAPPDGTPESAEFHPARIARIVLPDLATAPASMARQWISVRFFVGTSGSLDSFQVRGKVVPGFAKGLGRAFREWAFRPAVFRGCAVKGDPVAFALMVGSSNRAAEIAPVELVGRDPQVLPEAPWTEPVPSPREPANLPFTRDPRLADSVASCAKGRPQFSHGEAPDGAHVPGPGRVVLRFTIDTAGVPVDSTVHIMRQSSGPRFTSAVRKVFPVLRYAPAICGMAPASMVVQQTLLFRR